MKLTAGVFVVVALAATAFSAGPERVATSASGEVTADELESWGRHHPTRPFKPAFPSSGSMVENLVVQRVLAARIEELPTPVEAACRERIDLHRAELQARALKRSISAVSQPDVEFLRRAYDVRSEQFRRPKRWRLFNIFLRLPENATNQDRQTLGTKAQALRDRAVNGEDFSQLARTESDSPTAIRGGRIGIVDATAFRPEIAAIIATLEGGDISEIIETEDGFTILSCTHVYPPEMLRFDGVKRRLAARLARETFDSAWESLSGVVHRRITPTIRPAAAHHGRDDAVVLVARTFPITTRVTRSAYLWWATTHGSSADAETWTTAQHRGALSNLALTLGLADEAARRGSTVTTDFAERLQWETQRVAAECVIDDQVQSRLVPPTDAEISTFFDEHGDVLREPERRDLELLRVPLSPPIPPNLYLTLTDVAADVRDGVSTLEAAALALVDEGLDASHERLRSVPPFGVQSLGRPLATAVMNLDPGGVSEPVQDAGELIIARCDRVVAETPMTRDEAWPRIRRHLESQKRREIERTIVAEILAEQAIVMR